MSDPLTDAIAPRGERAITERDEIIVQNMHQEGAMERVVEAFRKIEMQEDFSPIIFGRVDGKIVFTKVDVKDGMYVLPDYKAPSKFELIVKRRYVKKIMADVNPILKRDIGQVTETALMRKSKEQLKKMVDGLKTEKKHTRLRNRVGCVFLEIGDEVIQI